MRTFQWGKERVWGIERRGKKLIVRWGRLGGKQQERTRTLDQEPLARVEEAKQILPDQGANLPPNFILALDADHKFAERMGSYQYPETYFIGPKGDILEKWVGVQKWLQPQVFEFFRQKLL